MKVKNIFAFVVLSLSLVSCNKNKNSEETIDLYCINDYHGRISQVQQDYHYEGGIARFATYLKNKMSDNPNGSVFLNAGDLWQDTYDSAMNNGELLTKAMVELNCEAMALGNHEFDWGLDNIRYNKSIAEAETNSTKFNFLGCNIYNYANGAATTQASDLASPYKIIERQGIKIGLIGGIGVNQITSITSSIWENITFVDPVKEVKKISDKLRTEEGCSVIVYLYHGSMEDANYKELSKVSPVSDEHYVDVGFLGHTHQFESLVYDDVAWVQSYQHGAVLGHVQLKVKNGNVSIEYCPNYENYSERNKNGYGNGAKSIFSSDEDPQIKALVNQYLTPEFVNKKETNIVSFTNAEFDTNLGSTFGGIQAYVTSEYINSLRESDPSIPEVDIVINNGTRDAVTLGDDLSLSYEDIFNLTPFTNKTIIANVKGRDIANECLSYSNPYYITSNSNLRLDEDEYYTVACIDYLLLHKSAQRSYNYFPSYTTSLYTIDDYPYELVWDYFEKVGSFDYATLDNRGYHGLSR